jgi:AAA15 family ATPase/GTPase
MGAICVIHGENNIGKSNVLEAMQLFFQFFLPEQVCNLLRNVLVRL